MRIDKFQSTYTFAFASPSIDSEEKEIMRRLMAYGVIPTGDKATDRATLRRLEEQKAKQEGVVTSKYLTVSPQQIQKWIDKRKENKSLGQNTINAGTDVKHNTGAEILAEYNKMMLVKKSKDKK